MSEIAGNNEIESLLSEQDRTRIKLQYVALFNALADYIRDFDNRIPVTNFKKLSVQTVKDLVDNKYEHNHSVYANELCTKLHIIKDKLKEFESEILRTIADLREVCQCSL